MYPIIQSWILQPSTTTPGLSKSTGAADSPAYSGSSKRFAGENEYTWCRTLSLFGNDTVDPTKTGFTRGTNSLSIWSRCSARGRAPAMALASFGTATTTASGTARPSLSVTVTARLPDCAQATDAQRTSAPAH